MSKKKKRAEKYDPKLSIKGSFEDVIGVSVGKQPPPAKPEKKEEQPKKKGKK